MPRNRFGHPDPYLCPLPADEATTANQRALRITAGFGVGILIFWPIVIATCACIMWQS